MSQANNPPSTSAPVYTTLSSPYQITSLPINSVPSTNNYSFNWSYQHEEYVTPTEKRLSAIEAKLEKIEIMLDVALNKMESRNHKEGRL